ncbi:MAG: hypothetical protein DCO99_00360 [Synechococcus sp. XM-24]|jgi:hypothetical protein|nr:MAG: hypothetical protein DCO99_00360 [Synechococcus sp. XM-24]
MVFAMASVAWCMNRMVSLAGVLVLLDDLYFALAFIPKCFGTISFPFPHLLLTAKPFRQGMTSLPITTSCYSLRISSLQGQLIQLLEEARLQHCAPERLETLQDQMKPLYRSLWAIYSELEQDDA